MLSFGPRRGGVRQVLDGECRAAGHHDDGEDREEDTGPAAPLAPLGPVREGPDGGRGPGRGPTGSGLLLARFARPGRLAGERERGHVDVLHVGGEGGPFGQALVDGRRPQRLRERAVPGRALEEFRRRGAVVRVLGETGPDELGQLRLQLAQRLQVGLLVDDAVQHAVPRLVPEGRPAARRVREDRPQREDVSGAAQPPLPRGLLGGHVGGSAHDHAGPGQPALFGGAGDTEVDEGQPVQGQHHVRGLEVAVHHVQRVHRRQARRRLAQQQPQGVPGQRAPVQGDGLTQGEPGNVGGGEPRRHRLAVAGEQRRGGVGGQPGEVVQLVPEAAQEVRVLPDDGGQELLDGDVPALLDAEVHPPHAAGPEPPRQRDRSDPKRILRLQRLGPAPRQVQHVVCPA